MKYLIKLRETESRTCVYQGLVRGKNMSCLIGTEFQFHAMKKFWKRMEVIIAS